jgi:hypothetical protein
MTLGGMRRLGVRSLAVSRHQCHHETIIYADRWPGHMRVPLFGPRMVCTKCGALVPTRGRTGESANPSGGRYGRGSPIAGKWLDERNSDLVAPLRLSVTFLQARRQSTRAEAVARSPLDVLNHKK